jgi:hypothetical protein
MDGRESCVWVYVASEICGWERMGGGYMGEVKAWG